MSVAWLVLPDFLLIVLGWVLHHRLGFSKEFFTGLEKLVYYVLFPALLLQSILKTSIRPAAAGDKFLATTALLALGFALVRSAGLFAALPCATAGYVMTFSRGGDGRWVSLMITIGILFSGLTITAWMILLR